MVLGSTQPLTEMSTRDISWGHSRSVLMTDNLTICMCRFSGNLGSLTSWRPVPFCNGIALSFVYGNNVKFECRGVEKWPHSFLTLALGGDSGQLYAAAIVHSASNWQAGNVPDRSWKVWSSEKSLSATENINTIDRLPRPTLVTTPSASYRLLNYETVPARYWRYDDSTLLNGVN